MILSTLSKIHYPPNCFIKTHRKALSLRKSAFCVIETSMIEQCFNVGEREPETLNVDETMRKEEKAKSHLLDKLSANVK
jgi:hypothetical protein